MTEFYWSLATNGVKSWSSALDSGAPIIVLKALLKTLSCIGRQCVCGVCILGMCHLVARLSYNLQVGGAYEQNVFRCQLSIFCSFKIADTVIPSE